MSFYSFMPRLLNMSLTSSVAIVLVILLRLALKKAPKVFSYALWGIVLFRLLCPISIGSSISVFNFIDTPAEDYGYISSVIEYVPADIVHSVNPTVVLPLPGVSEVVNEALPKGEEQLRADPLEGRTFLATVIWMTGVLVMGIYSIVSYLKLRLKLRVAIPLRENVFIADDIKSPFVVGLIRPRIYLPCNLSEVEQAYIILHEKHHIKRKDHVMKALAFIALAIHWFNPLVWVAFILAGKDMEMSCDEAVIQKVGSDVRADYSASLLTLATGRRIIAGTPLAFGEGDTKGRILNLAKWKKPGIWIIILSVILCGVLTVCLITNPSNGIHLYEIDDSRNYSDLLHERETITLSSFGKETSVSDMEGLLNALDEVKVGRTAIPSRSEDRDHSHQIILDGHTYINFSWDYTRVWIDNLVKPTYTYIVTNPLAVSQLFREFGRGNAGSEIATVGEIIPGTTYVPYQCIYMNPLSSYAAMGGDSGCKYILGGEYLVIINRGNGSIMSIAANPEGEVLDNGSGDSRAMVEVEDWDWQEFPYTNEEWEALFWPEGIFVIEDIREKYDNILYIRLSSEMFLMNVDGSIWIITVSNDPNVGTYIWSIYSLVPESAMGFAQWEFAPMLNSRLPVFRLEFDMDYTSIQATCDNGLLVPWDTPGSSSNTIMTYKEGCALYWSPNNKEDGTAVISTKILFTVMNGDTPVYQGNIYLDGSSGSDGRRIYNASLVGAGLYLAPNMENEGAVIVARDPSGDSKQVQLYDLTEDKLEIPIEELGNYAFYTNSTKISVKVKSNQDIEGSFTLIDVSQNNAEIAWFDINAKEKSCVFTNLTSARIYRIESHGLEGCTIVIK